MLFAPINQRFDEVFRSLASQPDKALSKLDMDFAHYVALPSRGNRLPCMNILVGSGVSKLMYCLRLPIYDIEVSP